ncbi:hypothetical protein ABZ897_60675 [Nonomuraea sp. NPDC046802]|uniref:hypothetical protein n=1 Tax=Nonomuraea sp. NPDC046802 TaxID=3154919 RepID=UPI0033DFD9E7
MEARACRPSEANARRQRFPNPVHHRPRRRPAHGAEAIWSARGYPNWPRRAWGAHARAVSMAWLLGVLDDILLDP